MHGFDNIDPIIGELINDSRKAIKAVIEAQDGATIKQVAWGLCCGRGGPHRRQCRHLRGPGARVPTWLVETVQQATETPCASGSLEPAAIESARAAHRGKPMINSISQ